MHLKHFWIIMVFKRACVGILNEYSKWMLKHCLLVQAWMMLYWSDITNYVRAFRSASHLDMCICWTQTCTHTNAGMEISIAWAKASQPCESTAVREPDEPAGLLYLYSLITALQKLPLVPRICLQWRWCSRPFCNHCSHLHLLRKCLCRTSWDHVIQNWTGPNCRWWFWGAEIGCN